MNGPSARPPGACFGSGSSTLPPVAPMLAMSWLLWVRRITGIRQLFAPARDSVYERTSFLPAPETGADRTTLHECTLPPSRAKRNAMAGCAVSDDHPDSKRRLTAILTSLCGAEAPLVTARLVDHFGSVPAILRASLPALERVLGNRRDLCRLIRAVGTLIREERRERLCAEPVLPNGEAVLDYLHTHMAHEPAEQVRVLYLDTKNRLLRDDVAARGTINRADIFPREIVRRALELGATGLIIAHNHPSGDARPSASDRAATRAIAEAAQLFDIAVHDHIIVGRNGWCSLRNDGHL